MPASPEKCSATFRCQARFAAGSTLIFFCRIPNPHRRAGSKIVSNINCRWAGSGNYLLARGLAANLNACFPGAIRLPRKYLPLPQKSAKMKAAMSQAKRIDLQLLQSYRSQSGQTIQALSLDRALLLVFLRQTRQTKNPFRPILVSARPNYQPLQPAM